MALIGNKIHHPLYTGIEYFSNPNKPNGKDQCQQFIFVNPHPGSKRKYGYGCQKMQPGIMLASKKRSNAFYRKPEAFYS
jgi:hypothetical protein